MYLKTCELIPNECIYPHVKYFTFVFTVTQTDSEVAPEVTGESCALFAGRQCVLLGHCSSTPPPFALARAGGSDDVTSTRAHQKHTHTYTDARAHTTHALLFFFFPLSLLPLRVSPLPLARGSASILGSGARNNPQCARALACVRPGACASCVSPDFSLTNKQTLTDNTADIYSGRGGARSAEPIGFTLVVCLFFTRNFPLFFAAF